MGFVINKIVRGQGLCFRKGNLLIFWNQRIYHPTFVIILNQSRRELCYAICCHDQVTDNPLFGILLLFHHPWSLKSTEKSLSWCIVISHQHPDFLPGHLMHFSQSHLVHVELSHPVAVATTLRSIEFLLYKVYYLILEMVYFRILS